jgi:ribose transport system permease protein
VTETSTPNPGLAKPSSTGQLLGSAARLLAPLAALVVLAAFFTWRNPAYLSEESRWLIVKQASVIVIVGIGQTLVIIAGGIDLSVGSVMAFSGTLAAVLMLKYGLPPAAAVLAGVLAGAAAGLFNGGISVKTKLHPFIITLGSMLIFRGLALAFTGAQSTNLLPKSFTSLGTGDVVLPVGGGRELWLGPILIYYILVVGVVAHFLLTRTRLGRYCFAIGSNRESTRLSGVPVDRWQTLYFVLAGMLFGLGGIVQVARLGAGDPKVGEGMELDAIAAAVIGGTSLAGGQGSIVGTILGALLMGSLRHGLAMIRLDDYWQQVALGVAIIIVVVYDRASRRRSV